MDIGKSIAVLILAATGLQLAECGWEIMTHEFPVESLLRGVVVTVVGVFLAKKFWRHDEEIRRWTIMFCKIAYVMFPLIFILGFITGGPLSINIPFLHTKTDSVVVMVALFAGALIYVVALHRLLMSRKAVAEFTGQTAATAGS
jgi:hypothetical protein